VLVELKCNEFKNGKGEPRPLIKFHAGLNAVVGAFGASSSVGKSTFLMALDFVFGGDDYFGKLKDVIHTHVPAHNFSFAFEFNEKRHYFVRGTGEIESVYPCNEKYVPTETAWSIQKYRDWLYEQYGLPTDNPVVRDHVSRFFRVYHRGNVSEKHPLYFGSGGKLEAIDCLLQLLGEQSLAYEKEALTASRKKLNVYIKAVAYNFIPGGATAQAIIENKQEIERLTERLDDLMNREQAQLEALNIANDNERVIAALRNKLSFLRQQRGQIDAQLEIIKRNAEIQRGEHFTERFDDLLEFFPNTNKPLLGAIERFHSQLNQMLSYEFDAVREKLNASLKIVDKEIGETEARITELGKRDKVAEDFAESYYGLRADIEKLKRQNESFKTLIDLENSVKAQKERIRLLENMKQQRLREASSLITRKMWDINEEICGDKLSAPSLTISALGQYSFNTFNDGGTSASYRGLAVFDLAVLALTRLPALAHDFVIINNIDVAQRERVFEYYAKQTDKQIFIALDDDETYSEAAKKLVETATVIRLSTVDGDVLFGSTWNTKEEQEHEQLSLFDLSAETTAAVETNETEDETDGVDDDEE
jgi:hypothetical protein